MKLISKIMKKLTEIQNPEDFHAAHEQVLRGNGGSVGSIMTDMGADRLKENPAQLADAPRVLREALETERQAEAKLAEAREKRKAALEAIDGWNSKVDTYQSLERQVADGKAAISEAERNTVSARKRIRTLIGKGAMALAQDIASVEAALPILKVAQGELEAELREHVKEMESFAKAHDIAPEYLPAAGRKRRAPAIETTEAEEDEETLANA